MYNKIRYDQRSFLFGYPVSKQKYVNKSPTQSLFQTDLNNSINYSRVISSTIIFDNFLKHPSQSQKPTEWKVSIKWIYQSN